MFNSNTFEGPECIHGNSLQIGCSKCEDEVRYGGRLLNIEQLDKEKYERGYTLFEDMMVDHPAHYSQGGIECIDAIEAALTPEEFIGFCKGNAMKYEWREKHKGGAESIKKAIWYLQRLLKVKQ